MTITEPKFVLQFLDKEPQSHVFLYTRQTGQQLYAVFPPGQRIDIWDAPDVLAPILLYVLGQWTDAGEYWLSRDAEEDPDDSADAR